MLTVYTARMGYVGADAFDITRGAGIGDGLAFAPSNVILAPALAAHRSGDPAREEAAWQVYVPAYFAEMRESYRRNRPAWDRVLSETLLTVMCFCTDPQRCHRTLLARDILPKLGARYAGERPKQRGTKADKLMASVDEELTLKGLR